MQILSIQYGNIMNPYARGGMTNSLHQNLKPLAARHKIVCRTGIMPGRPNRSFLDRILYVQKGLGSRKVINRLSFSFSAHSSRHYKGNDIVLIPWDRYAPVFIPARTLCPVILELRLEYFHAPSKLPFLEPLVKRILANSLAKCHYLISASKGVLDVAKAYTRNLRLSLISPSGVSEDLFSYPTNTGKKTYLLFLGRLDMRHKGIDTLIKAYYKARVDVPLIVAGDGPDRNAVRNLITAYALGPKITMTGWLEDQEKYEVLGNCLAVCVPSRVEGWGCVPMEAAAMAKPVIGTRVAGLTEAVINNSTGILVPKDDINALSEAIRVITADTALRTNLGENAKRRVRKFTWDRLADAREDFFLRVLEDFRHRTIPSSHSKTQGPVCRSHK